MQLDRPERGSRTERTGRWTCGWTDAERAKDIVNTAPEELARIVFEYGEERRSRRVAAAIVRARSRSPIETTDELAGVVASALGARRGGPHPARRTFQALRIAVNRELEELAASLPRAVEILAPGGRVVVIAYHSLEDRIVKRFYNGAEDLEVLTRKPLSPSPGRGSDEPQVTEREAPRRRTEPCRVSPARAPVRARRTSNAAAHPPLPRRPPLRPAPARTWDAAGRAHPCRPAAARRSRPSHRRSIGSCCSSTVVGRWSSASWS